MYFSFSVIDLWIVENFVIVFIIHENHKIYVYSIVKYVNLTQIYSDIRVIHNL